MPFATTDDGVRLHYEESGSGVPVIFVHEFAGDHRAWEAQMRHFGQRYRAITYAARGYPPSDVPDDVAKYSQARAADDIAAVLDHHHAWKVAVAGHTDLLGDEAFNVALSQRRAAAVKEALTARFHVDPSRLVTNGYGAGRPIDTNTTMEGRARNRRVELRRL